MRWRSISGGVMVDGMAWMPLSDDVVRILYSASVSNVLTALHWGKNSVPESL